MPFPAKTHSAFHSEKEISFFKMHFSTPLDSGEYFLIPDNCRGCHGFDTLGLANVDLNGMDVNLYDDWETSMMGLSAVDPFWRAKVSHEILVNPAHADEMQNLCTSCHAPLGHYTAFYKGLPHYTLADLQTDSLGLSGVSCHSCHAIGDSSALGNVFTGNIPYDTNRFAYGPFPGPMMGPMQLYAGLTPAYGAHVSESKFCSPCHTLINNPSDLNGNPTGGIFVEQATYHEWLNSNYPDQGITCQTCHMPSIEDPVKIANGYSALQGRSPFNLHQFAGANSFMVNLIKNNKTSLGVSASDANFDSTLAAINRMLTEQSLDITCSMDTSLNDTAYFTVQLRNKAGHKFPSGYPSRRAVLQFIVTDNNNDTIFASGLFDNNFELVQPGSPFQPHHNIITSETQAQVYQMVMGDVNGNITTVLDRAAILLKDNRIPPSGFTTSFSAYDTVAIAGDALTDPDFNKIGSTEGSGIDLVHYHIPLNGYNGTVNVTAQVYYQALPASFLNEMQNFSSAEIDTFLNMFAAADHTPVLTGKDTLQNVHLSVSIHETGYWKELTAGPNPVTKPDGKFIIYPGKLKISSVMVYDNQGKLVSVPQTMQSGNIILNLPSIPGIYYVKIQSGNYSTIKKAIRL